MAVQLNNVSCSAYCRHLHNDIPGVTATWEYLGGGPGNGAGFHAEDQFVQGVNFSIPLDHLHHNAPHGTSPLLLEAVRIYARLSFKR